jgi:hypothetical protein
MVQVHRVRLIYEGGALKPTKPAVLRKAMNEVQQYVEEVEVLVE